MKAWTVSKTEARELVRRAEKVRHEGGTSHAEVMREARRDMERELRRMVGEYDGSPRRAKELLEALVLAEDEGVESCAEIRHALAARTRRLHAA